MLQQATDNFQGALVEKAYLFDSLLELCFYSYDIECLDRNIPAAVNNLSKIDIAEFELQRLRLNSRLMLYIGFASYHYAERATWKTQVLGTFLERQDETPFLDPDLYVRRQNLRGFFRIGLDDYSNALDAVDRALSVQASIKNPQAQPFYVAASLSDSIYLLLAIGEIDRAWSVYQAAGDSIARSLPAATVPAILFRIREAELLEHWGDLPGAKSAYDAALSGLKSARIESDTRAWLTSTAQSNRAVICVLLNELNCANESIELHPYSAVDPNSETLDQSTLFSFLAAKSVVRTAQSMPIDSAIKEALKGAPNQNPELNSEELAFIEVVRLTGLALNSEPGAERANYQIEAARILIKERLAAKSPSLGSWYRPSAIERLALTLGANAVATAPEGKRDDELLFALVQILARTEKTQDADSLAAMLSSPDYAERRAIHQALRLRAKRDRLEREKISIVAESAKKPFEAARIDLDFGAQRPLAEFSRQISARRSLLEQNNLVSSVLPIAKLSDLQSALSDNEVVLQISPLLGSSALFTCVSGQGFYVSQHTLDYGQLINDIKLLQLSLTATHRRSEELDSQYPVSSAIRLYEAVFEPFKGCLRKGSTILWLPRLAELPIPLAALLRTPPPQLGNGYDLRKAEWLVNDYNIAYAGSATAIAKSRQFSALSNFKGEAFLGVGDPLLGGNLASNVTRQAAVLRGAIGAQELGDLAPLPETRQELIDSSLHFGSSTLLLGSDATEGNFRSLELSTYRGLSFATHGLIRDEIGGLTEPALVLTPESLDDSFDNGLLTAGEIADLSLQADFVALSACNTANYDLELMARDLPALASAFSAAGVPQVIGTLWAVETESSKAIVSTAIQDLATSNVIGSAEALSNAQRKFLMGASDRSWLHPRFWAAFVALGVSTGAVPENQLPSIELTDVEHLSLEGGEVLATLTKGDDRLARFIGPLRGERHTSVTQLVHKGREVWRHEDALVGASQELFFLGGDIAVGGYLSSNGGSDIFPTLELLDRKTGKRTHIWKAESQGVLSGAVKINDESALLAIQRGGGNQEAHFVDLFIVRDGLRMEKIESIELEHDFQRPEINLALYNGGILISYTLEGAFKAPELRPTNFDPFDFLICSSPWTRLEWRSLSGELVSQRRFEGVKIYDMDGNGTDRILFGGSLQSSCQEPEKPVLFKLDDQNELKPVYVGQQEVRSEIVGVAFAANSDVFVSVRRWNILDLERESLVNPDGSLKPIVFQQSRDTLISGEVQRISPAGDLVDRIPLSSGGDIFVASIERINEKSLLVGGAIGNRAAIFHISTP